MRTRDLGALAPTLREGGCGPEGLSQSSHPSHRPGSLGEHAARAHRRRSQTGEVSTPTPAPDLSLATPPAAVRRVLSPRTAVGLTAAASLVYGLGAGTRSNFGLLVQPLVEATGQGYSSISLVMAIAQLASGLAGPLAGALALRLSDRTALVAGALMTASGLALLPHASGMAALVAVMGILLPAGTGTLAFGVIMGVVSARMSRAQSTTASGVVTASAGVVGTLLSPTIAALLAALGLAGALTVLALPSLAVIPVIVWMCAVGLGRTRGAVGPAAASDASASPAPARPALRELLGRALRDRGYVLLVAAFFTCGFHMAIIETHLVSQMEHDGLTARGAALAFSAYGVAAVVGPIATGWLCGRAPMRLVLAGMYASRAVIVATFFALPTTPVTLVGFAVLLGLTGNSTVPPTSGLMELRFGPAALGTLFGGAFLSHQLGAFLSAWLGGVTVEATGGYGLIWALASTLSVAAAAAALLVPEARASASR